MGIYKKGEIKTPRYVKTCFLVDLVVDSVVSYFLPKLFCLSITKFLTVLFPKTLSMAWSLSMTLCSVLLPLFSSIMYSVFTLNYRVCKKRQPFLKSRNILDILRDDKEGWYNVIFLFFLNLTFSWSKACFLSSFFLKIFL